MSYDYFLECIDKIVKLDKNSYDNLINIFKESTNIYFDNYIDSLNQDEYMKKISKFEYYINISSIHTKVNEKYKDPNITAYYNDVSKYPVLTKEEENILLMKLFKLRSILRKRKINDEYLNMILNKCGYNKDIKSNLFERKKQLKYLKGINNKDLNKDIRKFELYVYYLNLKENFINCNLRLVITFLKRKKIKNCELLDYIQWGNEGLLYAIEKYDPKYNTKFSTYAFFWINCKINRGLFNEKKKIKSSYGMYLLSHQFNNFCIKYYSDYGIYPTNVEKIKFIYDKLYASKMDIKDEECLEKCKEKLNYIETMLEYENVSSLDTEIGDDLDNSIVDMVVDHSVNVEKEATMFELKDTISEAFSYLSKKQICVILLRNGIGIYNYLSFEDFQTVFSNLTVDMQKRIYKSKRYYTLQEIGELLNISRQAVNIVEKKAKQKMKLYENMFNDYL